MADENEADDGGDDRGKTADEAGAAGLEVLFDLAAAVIEDAHETSVAAVPDGHDAQLAHVATLSQAATDLTTLADACEVLIRHRHAEPNGAD